MTSLEVTLPPGTAALHVTRSVAAPVERVFRVFTARMEAWWPKSYRLGASERAAIIVEPRENGRWFERGADGSTCDWGRVLVWEPPQQVVLSWQIGIGFVPEPDPARASRIEIRFSEDGPGRTTVKLTHTGFEHHGAGWETMRDSLTAAGGWADLLEALASETLGSSEEPLILSTTPDP